MTEFCALLLAAGDGKRFGNDKRFVGSPPLLARTLDSLYASYHHIVLIHKDNDDLSNLNINTNKVTLLAHNKKPDSSLGASIARGVSYILQSDLNPTFCAVYLADMPFILNSTIDQLHKQCLNSNSSTRHAKCIVRPMYNGTRGHPVIFSEHFFSDLTRLKACEGAKGLIEKNEADYCEVTVKDQGVTIDIDTPDIAERLGIRAT